MGLKGKKFRSDEMAEVLILEKVAKDICYFREWSKQLDRWRFVTGCALRFFVCRYFVYKYYFVEQIEFELYIVCKCITVNPFTCSTTKRLKALNSQGTTKTP
jgi:hypothetical protein